MYLLLHRYCFTLYYSKFHIKSLQKCYKTGQYVIQNLAWSVVSLSSTLMNALLRKVLPLVPITADGSEFYVTTMKTFLYDSYEALNNTLTHMNSLNIKSFTGENITYFWSSILVYSERLESSADFNPEHLGYITCILEDTYNSILCIW